MKFGSLIVFTIAFSLPLELIGQSDYLRISLEFQHPLRIPNENIKIELIQTSEIAYAEVKSTPLKDDSVWVHTKIDTSFQLSAGHFDRLMKLVKEIPIQEIYSKIEPSGFGHDGTTGIIKFGNFDYQIAMSIWSPDYKPKSRGTTEFLEAFKEILKVGGFKPSKIL